MIRIRVLDPVGIYDNCKMKTVKVQSMIELIDHKVGLGFVSLHNTIIVQIGAVCKAIMSYPVDSDCVDLAKMTAVNLASLSDDDDEDEDGDRKSN